MWIFLGTESCTLYSLKIKQPAASIQKTICLNLAEFRDFKSDLLYYKIVI